MEISYLLLADGFEETEALGTLDVLRRAGMQVSTVSINPTNTVTGAHGVTVVADTILAPETQAPEWIILPGGLPGATNLAECAGVNEMLHRQMRQQGYIAAICASPAVVLTPLGILDEKKATCYPGFETGNVKWVTDGSHVVKDGNVITAAGPGYTFDFALAIVAEAMGADKAAEVAAGMLLK